MSQQYYSFIIILILSVFCLIKTQINVLGPLSIVQKVKELEDGSKNEILYKHKQ